MRLLQLVEIFTFFSLIYAQNSGQSCKAWTLSGDAECSWEPNLMPMTMDYGSGHTETFYAYVTPDVSTFYNETEKTRRPVNPRTTAQYGKFINMSPEIIRINWISGRPADAPVYIADIGPFESSGTATYISHRFQATPKDDPSKILKEWTMTQGNQIYYHDPFEFSLDKAKKSLKQDQLVLYHMQLVNKIFAEQYKQFTGRDWLALYKYKNAPSYHMWRADYIGQTYVIETKEIQFAELPEESELTRGTSIYGPRPDEKQKMRRHLTRDPTMNLTMTALSCSPRVFEIPNFLSDAEIQHLLHLAGKANFQRSSTRASQGSTVNSNDNTRTSTNDWIARNTDLVTDAIYRRAADLLQMNEALFRYRRDNEIPEFQESVISIAERLQLVHYEIGQEYKPHYDFTMPALVHLQPSRFATILFYLNGDMQGGETSFPLWLNAESGDALQVKPEKGKAVLFYNLLPDGNYDDRSLHASIPVRNGEKFLTNLWVWDPVLDHTIAKHF